MLSTLAGLLMFVLTVQEERIRRGDDLRLQMALEESKKEGPGSGKLAKKKKDVTHARAHTHTQTKMI